VSSYKILNEMAVGPNKDGPGRWVGPPLDIRRPAAASTQTGRAHGQASNNRSHFFQPPGSSTWFEELGWSQKPPPASRFLEGVNFSGSRYNAHQPRQVIFPRSRLMGSDDEDRLEIQNLVQVRTPDEVTKPSGAQSAFPRLPRAQPAGREARAPPASPPFLFSPRNMRPCGCPAGTFRSRHAQASPWLTKHRRGCVERTPISRRKGARPNGPRLIWITWPREGLGARRHGATFPTRWYTY